MRSLGNHQGVGELDADQPGGSETTSLSDILLEQIGECGLVCRGGTIQSATPNVSAVFPAENQGSIVGKQLQDIFRVPPGMDESELQLLRTIDDQVAVSVRVVGFRESDARLLRCSQSEQFVSESTRIEETALHRSRYQRLFEGLQDQYFLFGARPDGVLTYVSSNVERVFGYQASEVIGQNWRDFLDLNDPMNGEIEELERLRFDGTTTENRSYRCIVTKKDGSKRVIQVYDLAVCDELGNVVTNEGICQDVTDYFNAEKQLGRVQVELENRVRERTAELNRVNELYKSVVNHQTEFIVRWLPNGKQTFVNPAYCHYLGKDKEELLGSLISRLTNEQSRNGLLNVIRGLSPESPISNQVFTLTLENGLECWQRWTDHGVFDESGELVLIQSVGRDITKERRVEQMAQQVAVFRALLDNLSPRESQVLEMVSEGKANKVIARQLDLSVKTVEKHRSSMMRKLQVQSVAELVRKVIAAEQAGIR